MLLFYQFATRLSLTTCWQIVELQQDCWAQQPCSKLSTSWEQAVRTHPVDKLLEQHCYKSAAGLLQLVRIYVCTYKPRLHDSHFGYGTLKFWHADPRFLVRLLRSHDEIFALKNLGSARLNWERHSLKRKVY
jgi:hypothetical protein